MQEPDFISGHYDTGYIESHKATLLAPHAADANATTAAIQAAVIHAASESATAAAAPHRQASNEPSAWRAGHPGWRKP
jgi:hypothetical protein